MLYLSLSKGDFMTTRNRGFELVSKYNEEAQKREIKQPSRATKKSACYDIYNNTESDIVLAPGELSGAITTYFKSYMLDDEVLMAYVRSGHGFKFSVRLANSTGIIDCDYYNNEKNEGEIFIKLHNQGDKEMVIKVGEAMGQVMFQKYLLADNDADTVGGERTSGLGSTTKA
jgi:dUTP pyrophosphatase